MCVCGAAAAQVLSAWEGGAPPRAGMVQSTLDDFLLVHTLAPEDEAEMVYATGDENSSCAAPLELVCVDRPEPDSRRYPTDVSGRSLDSRRRGRKQSNSRDTLMF